MKKVVAEIRYDEDGRKVKRVETATDKCSGRDMKKRNSGNVVMVSKREE